MQIMFIHLPTATLITLLAALSVLVIVMLIVCLVLLQRTRKLHHQCEVERGTDALTGLWNRTRFMELAERQVNYVQRTGRSAAVLLIDLDECKKINHSYGHVAGDMAVRLISQAARDTVRDYDLLGRYSGEEIVVLLPDTTLEGAQAVAKRFREKLGAQKVTTTENKTFGVTVSVGIAALRCETDTLEDMLVGADAALVTAKAQGRDRVVAQGG
ncbi:diguanylate cyclase (GGDEF) domain-containing protein [Formivibrio citricus]|uniref:diguanylate cyclase n=2 Tax=Formivibrio citricus TaxID=83765 RepID=A0A1I4YNP3_9NEIS|nr:diguanylate cyclase (GGDEF) domain-containing protein [Formivibrio citricus]